MQRRRPRALQQLPGGNSNATVTVVRHDERRHEFTGAAPNSNGDAAQYSAVAARGAKAGRREYVAREECECISTLVVHRAFHDGNDAPRSANVVPHRQCRTAIAEDEMHFVTVSPRLIERCWSKRR